MSYKIRELQQIDIPKIAHTYIEAYTNSVWGEAWDYEAALCRIHELSSSPCCRALICESNNNEIVGCIFCEILSWHTGKQIEIKEVFVSSKYRGIGVGSKLVKSVEELGKIEGVSELLLWTNCCKELKSFYESMGYYTCKEVVQFIKKTEECK